MSSGHTEDQLIKTFKPLNVLFISRKWFPAIGGMETYSVELCTELDNLVSLTTRVLHGRTNGYPPTLFHLLMFMLSSAGYLLARGHRYDVVHFGDLLLFPLAWLHARTHPRKARFITVHGLDLLYGNRSGLAPWVYRNFMAWTRLNAKLIHGYLANSKYTSRLAREAGLEPNIVIPLGVRLDFMAGQSTEIAQPPYLLFIGRLVPRKGAAWFAEYVLPRLDPNIRLHVVGKSWDLNETTSLAGNPRVDLFGYLNDQDLKNQRMACLAIVMPNRSNPTATDVEGFGITALEAARDGVPLLAAKIEGISDAVVDGETGFLLPEGDANAWVEAINVICTWSNAERIAFAAKAQQVISEHFSWRRVASDTVMAYLRYGLGAICNDHLK